MTRYRRAAGVSATAVDQDLYLVHPASQEIYHLDAMAAALWRLLAEAQTEAALTAAFAAAFPAVETARIEADLAQALAGLVGPGLIIRD